jgi:hypothetical protein
MLFSIYHINTIPFVALIYIDLQYEYIEPLESLAQWKKCIAKRVTMAKAAHKAKRLENYNTRVALLTLYLYQKSGFRI